MNPTELVATDSPAAGSEEPPHLLEQELSGMQVLQRISGEFVTAANPAALYEMLVDAARTLMHSEFSSMQMLDPEGNLRLLAFRGFNPQAAKFLQTVRPTCSCTCGVALRLLRRIVVSDVETCDFMAGTDHLTTYRRTGIRSVQTTPLFSRDGRVVGMISTHWSRPYTLREGELRLLDLLARQAADAIERQQADEAVRRSEAELRTLATDLERRVLERTADLREANARMMSFSYSVSHDLRAPLRAIRGYLDVLADELGDEARRSGGEFLWKISTAVDRMDRLIGDLLAHTRMSRVNLENAKVPLARCIDEAIRQAQTASDAFAISVKVPPGLQVVANGSTLVQVIWNLIANAVKFVAPGVQPMIQIFCEERPGWVRLWVADNGIGIAPRHHDRIFRMFERLHGEQAYEGTGLGLALVKNAIERMGGTVGVDSDEGAGSRFWIELPLAA